MPSVSIHLVTYNDKNYLPDCLQSIFNLQRENEQGIVVDHSVLIIDNASSDGTVEYLQEFWPQVRLVVNRKNEGFCRTHNKAIHFTKSAYVLVVNPDTVMEKDFLIKLVAAAEGDPSIGLLGGLLLRAQLDVETLETTKTNLIDSLGIAVKKSRRFYELGAGEYAFNYTGERNGLREVFGVSGALALYRRHALDDIKYDQEFFDEDFFAYKEDVDICWRLRLNGWNCCVLPDAIAYHFRAVGSNGNNLKDIINGRKERSSFVKRLSYRNHFLVIYKNSDRINLWLDFVWIFFYEFKKFFYILFFEPRVLRGLVDFFRLKKKMKLKRRQIMEQRRVFRQEMRKWFR